MCTLMYLSLISIRVAGHAVMYEPPVRQSGGMAILAPGCPGGSCLWFNQGCSIGCPRCTGKGNVVGPADCAHPDKPTIAFSDHKLRTWDLARGPLGDWTATHPWRKPGSAPVEEPCGLACGWYTKGTAGNGGEPPPGVPCGTKGSELPPLFKKTVWIAGSTVEVAWAIYANHGGGYQYRLCPAGGKITEQCFQKTPLEFVGDTQWIQFGDGLDVNNRTEIPAVRVSEGTVPAGSTWTRNPIPACGTPVSGGALNTPCIGYQFSPPLPGIGGFGGGACASGVAIGCSPAQFKKRSFQWGVVDKVKVPQLPPGDYVLGFRWESEQTPQVWQSCGDVTIKSTGTPTTPFMSYEGCEACCAAMPTGVCANCTKCLDDKTGDCGYCWKPLKGYDPGFYPRATCLGHEGPSGGMGKWRPGDKMIAGWSPGCPKCWKEAEECKHLGQDVVV